MVHSFELIWRRIVCWKISHFCDSIVTYLVHVMFLSVWSESVDIEVVYVSYCQGVSVWLFHFNALLVQELMGFGYLPPSHLFRKLWTFFNDDVAIPLVGLRKEEGI